MKGYSVFLMYQISIASGLIDPQLEYDLAWEKASGLYKEFVTSDFNLVNKGEYDCIQEFVSNKLYETANRTSVSTYTKEQVREKISNSVFNGESSIFGLKLPSPQKTGTLTQQRAYANQVADKFLERYKIVDITLTRTTTATETRSFLVSKDLRGADLVEFLIEDTTIDDVLGQAVDNSENLESESEYHFCDEEDKFGGTL